MIDKKHLTLYKLIQIA